MAFDYAKMKAECVLAGDVTFVSGEQLGDNKKISAADLTAFIRGFIGNPQEVLGGLHFRGYDVDGTFSLANADLDFPIYFDHCRFEGFLEFSGLSCKAIGFMGSTLEKGIDLRAAMVKGYMLMNAGFVCRGPLLLRDAKITQSLEFQKASFLFDGAKDWHKGRDAEGECCSLSRVDCLAIYWQDIAAKPAAKVNFRDMTTRTFKNDLQADADLGNWPARGDLILDGFTYARFSQCNPTQALRWIALQNPVTTSSLSNLAKAYDNESLKQNANVVLAELKKIEIRQIANPIIRVLNYVTFWLIGFGIKLQRPLVIFLLIFLLHVGLTTYFQEHGLTQPNISEYLTEDCVSGESADCASEKLGRWQKATVGSPPQDIFIPSHYPRLVPLLYSMESLFPFFDFHQKKYWEFSDSILNFLMGLIAACALFISGVFVGGISGILIPKADG